MQPIPPDFPKLGSHRISNDKNRNWVEIWCPTTQDPKKQQNPGDGTLIIHIDGSPDDQIKISHDLQMKLLQDIKKQNLKPTPKK